MADSSNGQASGAGEGLYWRYESALKRLDSRLWSVAGAAGELFSLRTDLWEPLPEDTLLDDFVVSLRVAAKGYRIAYAPDAWASESPSANLREEWKRKVRITAGGFQSMARLSGLFRVPRLAFVYISHRVLRWTIMPAMLPVLPLLAVWLAAESGSPLYVGIAVLAVAGLVGTLAAWYRLAREQSAGCLTPFFYFVFMNAAVWAGAARMARGRQRVTWERAVRHTAAPGI